MLDGNRRWARKAGFTNPNEGHRAGAAHIADLLEWCQEAGIGMVTLWLLSTENLRRADDELLPLLEIITDVVDELAAPGPAVETAHRRGAWTCSATGCPPG